MLACVAGSMPWMNNWQLESFRTLDSHRTTIKTSELASWKTFTFFQNTHLQFSQVNNLFHLNSMRCKLRHRCHNYRRGTITKTPFFTSVQNSHRTLQLAVEKHSFLSKCWFTMSYEHSSSFQLRTFAPKSSYVQIFLKLWLQVENDKIRLKT